ncbi:MAG: biotin--[acetyl-CoA-carboxylase] ligase [Woeseiaceae bacterium]|nr:biotin--[acetyl-CoA-carboxylase] ligase [Woeseiaceae bacterium]
MTAMTPESVRELIDLRWLDGLLQLEVFGELDSTNSYLLQQPRPAAGRWRVAIAERQTRGRGRRGRVWVSPPSSGLYLSLAFSFAAVPRDLPSLSLAAGVGIARYLEKIGTNDVGVKWPNDIVARNGKLGGILSEVHTLRGAGLTIVVGVGLNLDFGNGGPAIQSSLGKAVDLASCCEVMPSRSKLAAGVIAALIDALQRFETEGFSNFHETWRRYDWLRGRQVAVERNATTNAGIADGVDTDGALLLNEDGQIRRITSGSVAVLENPGMQP